MLELFAAAALAVAPVTECDRLAAHPSDPDRVAPGVAQPDVDLARAIPACQAAVKAYPDSGRLNYQLARSLGYAGRGREAGPNRDAAVKADYPQALFVVGYIHLLGLNDAEKDACKAADLVRRSALKGRQAGLIGYPAWTLEGRFEGCPTPRDKAEMAGFLDKARAQSGGEFFQTLLIDALVRDVGALP
jgi:hypothetical protein